MGSGRKRDFAKVVFVDPVKRRRFRLLVVVLVALVGLAGLGYARLELPQDRMVSAAVSSAPEEGAPRPPAADEGDPPAERSKAPTHLSGSETALAVSAPEKTCDDVRVLVDRSHTLPPDYVPEDLVSLPASGVPTLGGREMLLRRKATERLSDLMSAAAAAGEELVVASAFRSYEEQKFSHRRLKSIYGSGADAMSATPGHSQHQLGTAVDFTNATAAYQIQRSFGYSTAALWLREHATGYGFVLAYPPGDDKSGFAWEPWHYRYVGVENAEELEKSGLSLQEFLVREGILPNC